MTKRFTRALLLLFTCLFFHPAFEWNGSAATVPLVWRWSNPLPHGNNIVDMTYGGGLLIQVGERGQIYTTEDFDSWTPRNSGTTEALRGVALFGSRIVISGANGTMLYADSLNHFQRINLGTGDWLEGVAASTDLAVAVGDRGAIYTSSDGIAWVRRPQSFTTWLRSVAYSSGMFVAVGETGFVAVSVNGTSWQQRSSGISEHLNRVFWLNDRFVALGNAGRVLQSFDLGSTWQAMSPAPGAANALFAGTGSINSQLLLGDAEFRFRTNRFSDWRNEFTVNLPNRPPLWTYYSTVLTETLFLAAGRSGMLVEGFRTNSADYVWVENAPSLRNWLWDVRRYPDFYVAVGDYGTIMTSANGIRWQLELLTPAPGSSLDLENLILLGVGGTTNGLVAVGNQGALFYSPKTVLSTNPGSTLGVVWHEIQPRPSINDLQGITALGNIFVAGGGGGTILVSSNGTNWLARSSGTSSFLSSVETFPGGVVAVGDRGTILTSADTLQWQARSSGTTNWLYQVRYLNGLLIAVGQGGTILTSPNGITWTSRPSGTTRWLNGIDYVDGLYLAVGVQGTVLASTNAIAWTNVGTITTKSLYGAGSHQGQFITVGVEGAILRSQVTPRLTPVNIESYDRTTFTNFAENAFLFSGYPDQRFTLQYSLNLTNWFNAAAFEFFSGSSTLLYLERGVSAPFEFYRTRVEP